MTEAFTPLELAKAGFFGGCLLIAFFGFIWRKMGSDGYGHMILPNALSGSIILTMLAGAYWYALAQPEIDPLDSDSTEIVEP